MDERPASTATGPSMSALQRDRFLARSLIARLATSRNDRPRVLPMWFLWDDGHVWMETGATFPNVRVLRENPHVAIAVDESDGGLRFRAVLMRGTVEIIEEPGEFVASMVRRIYTKYVGSDGLETPEVAVMLAGDHVILRFTPASEITWDHDR